MPFTFTGVTGVQNGETGEHYLNTASISPANGILIKGNTFVSGPNANYPNNVFQTKGDNINWATLAKATITADYETGTGNLTIKTTGTLTAHTFDYTVADRDGVILGTAAGVGSAATTVAIAEAMCTYGFLVRAVDRTTGEKSEAFFTPDLITPHA